MNNFLALVNSRYSVRSYQDKPVEEEKLNYILECGRMAPSAANYQPWHVIVIQDKAMRELLSMTYSRAWLTQAPVILVVCGDHDLAWKRADGKDHTDIDISIMVDHMTLASAEQGLGTCWICNFNAHKACELLKLPPNLEPIAFLSLGYPGKETDSHSRHHLRKSLSEIVHWGKY